MWLEEERKFKVFARNRFFANVDYSMAYLTLPGEDCADVDYALRHQVIDGDTAVTAVERDGYAFRKICLWFANHWHGSLQPCLIHDHLHNVCELQKSDLVFLDYLGNISANDAFWVQSVLSRSLLPSAHLGLTVAVAYRNNHFMRAIREGFQHYFPDYYDSTSIEVRDSGSYPKAMLPCLATYTMLLRCYLFRTFNFSMGIDYYGEPKSTYVMALFRLEQMNKSRSRLGATEKQVMEFVGDIVSKKRTLAEPVVAQVPPDKIPTPLLRSKPMATTPKGREGAGQRAWKTRRENARKQMLSDRAKKAWRTRRKRAAAG